MADFKRSLCVRDAVAVTSAWDNQLHRIFHRLWTVVSADLPGADVTIVAVDGPPTLPTAWTCGDSRRNTIAFTVRALGRLNTFHEPEPLVAITVAHELAHVLLHQGRSWGPTSEAEELEADTLAVYYYERAGYDCRRWIGGEGYAHTAARMRAAQSACADVKGGMRPALRRAT
jgi:hypothetical protein